MFLRLMSTSCSHRLQTSACPTSTSVMSFSRPSAAALCTPPRRSSMEGLTVGRRWTPGLLVCCCTRWFTAPCHLMETTTRHWSNRSALETIVNPPTPLVSLSSQLFILVMVWIQMERLTGFFFSIALPLRCMWAYTLDANGKSRAQGHNRGDCRTLVA